MSFATVVGDRQLAYITKILAILVSLRNGRCGNYSPIFPLQNTGGS